MVDLGCLGGRPRYRGGRPRYPCYTQGIMVGTTGIHETNHTTSTTPTIPTDIIYYTYWTNPTTYLSYVVPLTNSSIETYREGTPGGYPMVICVCCNILHWHTRRIPDISTPGGFFIGTPGGYPIAKFLFQLCCILRVVILAASVCADWSATKKNIFQK